MTNTGSEDLKVLKYGTVLDSELPTRSFTVTKDGRMAKFTGIKIHVDLTRADDSAFVVIPAGQTVTAEHEGLYLGVHSISFCCVLTTDDTVAPLYDFASLGVGNYTFEPVTTFQVVAPEPSVFQVTAPTVGVVIHSDVAKRTLKVLASRSTVNCSDTSKNSLITSRYVYVRDVQNEG